MIDSYTGRKRILPRRDPLRERTSASRAHLRVGRWVIGFFVGRAFECFLGTSD